MYRHALYRLRLAAGREQYPAKINRGPGIRYRPEESIRSLQAARPGRHPYPERHGILQRLSKNHPPMNIAIIEDELLTADDLAELVGNLGPDIQIVAILDSVKKATDFFQHAASIDPVFAA